MFFPGHWAAAFINSLEDKGAEAGIDLLAVFASWVKSLSGEAAGSFAADNVERLAREALSRTGRGSPGNSEGAAAETALRFIVLMIRKNRFQHIDSVIEEAKKIMDKKNGVVKASVEYALPPDEDFISRVKESIKRKTGAAEVELERRTNPGLAGGYRLWIGDEVIDASVLFQMRQMEAALSAGISGGISGPAALPARGGN